MGCSYCEAPMSVDHSAMIGFQLRLQKDQNGVYFTKWSAISQLCQEAPGGWGAVVGPSWETLEGGSDPLTIKYHHGDHWNGRQGNLTHPWAKYSPEVPSGKWVVPTKLMSEPWGILLYSCYIPGGIPPPRGESWSSFLGRRRIWKTLSFLK